MFLMSLNSLGNFLPFQVKLRYKILCWDWVIWPHEHFIEKHKFYLTLFSNSKMVFGFRFHTEYMFYGKYANTLMTNVDFQFWFTMNAALTTSDHNSYVVSITRDFIFLPFRFDSILCLLMGPLQIHMKIGNNMGLLLYLGVIPFFHF